jgi:hypothetical protein
VKNVVAALVCVECETSSEFFERGWRAYLLTEPDEGIVVLCPICAEREFGEDEHLLDL